MYQNIEKLMIAHNESAADLSRATGISQITISQWKRRNGSMSVENAVKIAQHYGVTVEELLGKGSD